MGAASSQFNFNKLPRRGFSRSRIREEVEERLSEDLRFGSGRILGSMCSEPDPFAAEVYASQLEKNLGDPGLHPALSRMERDTLDIIGSILGAKEEAVAGALVSGGTEANILALWTAKLHSNPSRRTVVLPESAHFSFDKAASLMDLELRKISVDRHHRFSMDEFRAAVDEQTMAVVGIAGTTGLGIVDPIPQMAEIAEEHEVYFHVDAAFGGFVLPFLEEAGYRSAPFNFSVPGVHSIAVDPHKMGRAPIPSGCILYRNEEIAEISRTKVGYLSGGATAHQTIVGTRSGAAAAAVWATLQTYGHEGFVETVRSCMENTEYLAEAIRSDNLLELMTTPFMNVVGFRPGKNPDAVKPLIQSLRRRGYALSLFPGFLRVSVMPHVNKDALDLFLKEVTDALPRNV